MRAILQFLLALVSLSSSPQSDCINTLEKMYIRFYGLQRSGNHVFMQWVASNRGGGRTLIFNNCSFVSGCNVFAARIKGKKPSPDKLQEPAEESVFAAMTIYVQEGNGDVQRVTVKVSDIDSRDAFVVQDLPTGADHTKLDESWHKYADDSRWDKILDSMTPEQKAEYIKNFEARITFALERSIETDNVKTEITSVEELDVNFLQGVPWKKSPEKQTHKVAIIRDFKNWVASRLKSGREVNKQVLENWRKIALRAQKSGDGFLPDKDGFIYVKFNKFIDRNDSSYRKKLAEFLELETYDRGLDIVHVAGGGSSFDKLQSDNKGSEMDVTSRSQMLADNEEFQKILRENSDLVALSEEIFGN